MVFPSSMFESGHEETFMDPVWGHATEKKIMKLTKGKERLRKCFRLKEIKET